MDAEGARALARRIAEQQAREEEQAREARRATAGAELPDEPPRPTAPLAPIEEPPVAPREKPSTTEGNDDDVRVPRQESGGSRDIRMYSRSTETKIVDGMPAVVTTVHCRTLVGGEWQSRVVRVDVQQSDPAA